MNRKELENKAKEILELAEQLEEQQSYLFITTCNRYLVQLRIHDELEDKINAEGTLVTKEYVKGRENIYTHPAITEFNRTSTSANQTVQTLIKIIKDLKKQKNTEQQDKLLEILGEE